MKTKTSLRTARYEAGSNPERKSYKNGLLHCFAVRNDGKEFPPLEWAAYFIPLRRGQTAYFIPLRRGQGEEKQETFFPPPLSPSGGG